MSRYTLTEPSAPIGANTTFGRVSPANTLTFDDETVDDLSDRAEDDRDKINLIEKYVPAAALVAGAVLLVLGLVLIFLRRESQDSGATPKADSDAGTEKAAEPVAAEKSEPKEAEASETKVEPDEPASTEDKPKTD